MSDPQPIKLSLVALAWNEAAHLRPCFRSLAALMEHPEVESLIILDEKADAATVEAAGKAAQRVVRSPFTNFSQQRNRALELVRGEWVFFIDPDERATPELITEIWRVVSEPTDWGAARVPRRNILFGREVKHTGWWPDYQIRLLRRSVTHYDETRAVHELAEFEGALGTLVAPLIHYNYDTWGQFIRKQRAYAALDASALHSSGVRARMRSLVGQPLREFKRRFFDYEGWRDGVLGFALSAAMALYAAETYRRLLLLQRRENRSR